MPDSIPLALLARGSRSRRRMVPIDYSGVLERELRDIINILVKFWVEATHSRLEPMYSPPALLIQDADQGQLLRMIESLGLEADGIIVYQTQLLGRWVTRVGAWHGNRTIKAVKSATGVDITPYMLMSDIAEQLQNAVERNVALARKLSRDTQSRLASVIMQSFLLRRNKRDTLREIAKALGTTQVAARRIAEDQHRKLVAALTQMRQMQLGIRKYRWVTRGDDRVRQHHRERNGRVFSWSSPPFDGHPGHPVNCRCVPEAVLEF